MRGRKLAREAELQPKYHRPLVVSGPVWNPQGGKYSDGAWCVKVTRRVSEQYVDDQRRFARRWIQQVAFVEVGQKVLGRIIDNEGFYYYLLAGDRAYIEARANEIMVHRFGKDWRSVVFDNLTSPKPVV